MKDLSVQEGLSSVKSFAAKSSKIENQINLNKKKLSGIKNQVSRNY